ncbi:response regulator [Halomonas vilamensis]|uniref:Response regulator n=1 Tax=Vreelandella vilamensis TaxID=531309 RepID=A0ABU1H104_9GAMM|nr:response regulator [Halomonas vilamensis]MDR5897948.1 response regulator [Halomonas vilamensis]
MNPTATATIAIVDDDQALRDSLVWLLSSVGLEAQIFANGETFLAATTTWQVVLLDVRMPGLSGLQVQQQLADQGNTAQVIMMTGHGDVPMAVTALKNGAFDFIEKPFNHQQLIDSVQQALSLAQQQRHQEQSLSTLRQRFNVLRPKEQLIVKYVAEGMTSREIATQMTLSSKTVEVYRQRAMKILGVTNAAALVRYAVALGVVDRLAVT